MKKYWLLLAFALWAARESLTAAGESVCNEPDSVYLFAYALAADTGRSGLKFAWSTDGCRWMDVGGGFGYVTCDFGRWGSQKRMIHPALMRGNDDTWHCVWQLDETGYNWGYTTSADLLKWKPQVYVETNGKPPKELSTGVDKVVLEMRETIVLGEDTLSGCVVHVPYTDIERLVRFAEQRKFRERQNDERTEQDNIRFAGLDSVRAAIRVQADERKSVSDHLIGIFFEDINYSADGGLYAELVQNRDFEYAATDGSKVPDWDAVYAWHVAGGDADLSVEELHPIHPNNPHYAVLEIRHPGAALVNAGFDGMAVKRAEKYDFSVFASVFEGTKSGNVVVKLLTPNGNELAHAVIRVSSTEWKKYSAVLVPAADAVDAVLAICPQTTGKYGFDLISLFPQKTFNGRKNGLRADLAQALADLHPRFVRFPGGCVAHGDGVDNIYDWKGSIGPLEARKPLRNLWGYHQTRGLGYHEYFLFCEDLHAEPVPVLAAGVPCQNSSTCSHHSQGVIGCGGQQGGIPMEEMPQYVQDVLDLIEYANGDAKRTEWGRKRAEAGHLAPFNLKYVGIGNEDLISPVFKERFAMIYEAVKTTYPEITVIGTVGPFYEGSDYDEGWAFATQIGVPMVDEHYYNPPGWFIHNSDFYDRYDRRKSRVYLGEYAAHLPGQPNNVETALAEALYLTSVERNADVVTMASYAPLLAKEGHTQWNPDLIYFNNTEVKPTVGYYVQQLYGQHGGDEYLPVSVVLDNMQEGVKKRIGVSVVSDSRTSDVILKMVNLLPVEVNAEVEIPLPEGMDTMAEKIVLAGHPTDRQARPVSGTWKVDEQFAYTLPPYSFTVIRIHKLQEK